MKAEEPDIKSEAKTEKKAGHWDFILNTCAYLTRTYTRMVNMALNDEKRKEDNFINSGGEGQRKISLEERSRRMDIEEVKINVCRASENRESRMNSEAKKSEGDCQLKAQTNQELKIEVKNSLKVSKHEDMCKDQNVEGKGIPLESTFKPSCFREFMRVLGEDLRSEYPDMLIEKEGTTDGGDLSADRSKMLIEEPDEIEQLNVIDEQEIAVQVDETQDNEAALKTNNTGLKDFRNGSRKAKTPRIEEPRIYN